MLEGMTSGHFIFIPAVLLFGVVIGWILGARAASDAYAMELQRRAKRINTTTVDPTTASPP